MNATITDGLVLQYCKKLRVNRSENFARQRQTTALKNTCPGQFHLYLKVILSYHHIYLG